MTRARLVWRTSRDGGEIALDGKRIGHFWHEGISWNWMVGCFQGRGYANIHQLASDAARRARKIGLERFADAV